MGLRRSLYNVASELNIQFQHWVSLRRARRFEASSDLKLHFGSGPHYKVGWLNIDLSANADLKLDLREHLPFRTDSAALIYSEHFFEHLEYPNEALRLLQESLRVLRPGGLFSLAVPDTEWILTAYASHDEEVFRMARELWHPEWCDTPLHNVNYHFRQGHEHKYAYDFETLERILGNVGFTGIAKNPSQNFKHQQ